MKRSVALAGLGDSRAEAGRSGFLPPSRTSGFHSSPHSSGSLSRCTESVIDAANEERKADLVDVDKACHCLHFLLPEHCLTLVAFTPGALPLVALARHRSPSCRTI